MTARTEKDKSRNKKTVYIKPVLSYDQLVEIIDERIAEIERASKRKIINRKKK